MLAPVCGVLESVGCAVRTACRFPTSVCAAHPGGWHGRCLSRRGFGRVFYSRLQRKRADAARVWLV